MTGTARRTRPGRRRGLVANAARTALLLAPLLVVASLTAPHPDPPERSVPVGTTRAGVATVPRPDHIVVVVEENHTQQQVVGNPDAPWLTGLAQRGANLTSSYAVTHPSQPNYLALFSGSTQGLVDDSCPHSYTGPNLASQLADAGLSFTGYSETMPAAGYTGCYGAGGYARKHNPWVDFPALPAVVNQPFSSFPTDYSTLPAVSFVIPNLQNDMHDGTVAQGDSWLAGKLGGYADWAQTHNSLLVVTFDEDDGSAANRIATIVSGQQVVPGTYPENVTHYNVLRTIQDAFGLTPSGETVTAAPITDIFAAPTGDAPPAASFTSGCTATSCSFDGRGSSDPDGTVASWAWDFGDGTTGTGATASHTYTEGGVYTVGLTVTDDLGATATVTAQVTSGDAFVVDTFDRTVANGFGRARLGGTWTTAGAAANLAVTPSAGTLALPAAGSQVGAYLGTTTRTDTEVAATLALRAVPVGGPAYLTVQGRRVSGGNEYDAKLLVNADRSVTVRLTRIAGGVETTLGTPVTVLGLGYTAGLPLRVRLQVTGTSPTTVRARAWRADAAEPTTWPVSTTDATPALQQAGAVGVVGYLSSRVTNAPNSVAVTDVRARPTTAPTNVAPTAAFTGNCAQQTCTFSAADSTDPDGTITSYAWDYGDGATGSGVSSSHTYAVAGNHDVTLTVTDQKGASARVTRTVTSTAPPVNQPPVARFTMQCTARACSFDGGASTDDEEVETWTWTFGDGATATGQTTTHTYVGGGDFVVRLTVVDEYDATDSTTRTLTLAGPFVRDTFGRVVSNGLGTADAGGTWTTTGAASAFSVQPGFATLRLAAAGSLLKCWLPTAARPGADLVTALRLSAVPVGGPAYLTVTGRRVDAANEYAARLFVYPNRAVTLRVVRVLAGVETALAGPITLPGVTYSPGLQLNVRLQVTGSSPTTVRAKSWPITAGEPAGWQVSGTDSSPALQVNGAVGLAGQLSSAATNAPIAVDVTTLTADSP